ncbi:MAG: GNAT family N-acetyltransferase [Aquaticitalea sp.]
MIRKATNSDIDKVIEVTKQCAQYLIDKSIFQWNEHYPNRRTFETDVLRDELYVLVKNNSILGCVVISTFMDEIYIPVKWLTPNKNNYYIHRLAVHPNYQRKGFARQIMDYAEILSKEKNQTSIRLDTFSQNKRNQMFYEQRGYKRLDSIYFPKQSEFPFYCYELIL